MPARDGDTGPISRAGHRRRPRGALAFALMLLLAGGLSVTAWWFAAGPGAFTTVPSVVNTDPALASATLERAGLRVERSTDYSETVAPNLVRTPSRVQTSGSGRRERSPSSSPGDPSASRRPPW